MLCGSADLAEDLVQETYARVLARPRLLRGDDAFSYMARALRNTFYNHLRSARARPEQALAADQREVVALVDIAGLSYKEAARVLRVPPGTVMSRLYSGRARLAEALS